MLLGLASLFARPLQAQSCGGPFHWVAQSAVETFTGNGQAFSFTPTQPGTFTITLSDATATATATVVVGPTLVAWPAVGAPPDGNHTPLDGGCRFARATSYAATFSGGIPSGTCGYQAAGTDAPQLVRNSYVVAPNEAFYRFGGGQTACGQCLELTGPAGRITAMVSDICDVMCCDNCRGDVVNFDVENTHWTELSNTSGGNVAISYRWVSCPVTGNIKGMFSSFTTNGTFFRITIFNQRVPVASVEALGPGTAGSWIALQTTNFGQFDWTGHGNIGFPLQLRVTSQQGQVVTFPALATISPSQEITAGGQFADQANTNQALCAWPGPPPVVYDDQLEGILGVTWRDWGSFSLPNGPPNYASTTACEAGSNCISVGAIGGFGALFIGTDAKFPVSMFKSIEFWARTTSGSYGNLNFTYGGTNASGTSANSTAVPLALTGTWQKLAIDLAPISGSVTQMQTLRWQNQASTTSPPIVVDEIRLIP